MQKLFFLSLFFLGCQLLQAQAIKKETVLDKAHNRKFISKEFSKTDNHNFQYAIYNIENAITNKTHHWFLKLASPKNEPLNFATITLNGYLKSNPSIPFNYGDTVFPLCTEGKYIIGFVKVKQAGTWVLEATVNNFGSKDHLTFEIEIEENPVLSLPR